MSRGIALFVVATLLAVIAGFALWLEHETPAEAPGQRALVTQIEARPDAGTVLPQGVATRDVEPLASPPPDPQAESSDARSAGAASADESHPWPLKTLSLSGRVVDTRGHPLEAATVILNPSRQSRKQLGFPASYFVEAPPWDEYPQSTTGTDGRFVFSAQAAGDPQGNRIPIPDSVSYEYDPSTALVVRLAGFVPAAALVPTDGWTVPMGDIVLEDACIVVGRLVDPSSIPLPDVRVAIALWGRKDEGKDKPTWPLVSWLIETRSVQDGRFRLDTLDPGRYRLEFEGEGYQVHFEDVEVAAGQTVDLGDLLIQPGRVLAGRVVDQDGNGLPGVQLKARPKNLLNLSAGEDTALRDIRVTVRSSSGEREVSQESGPDGSFRFADLDNTTYHLFAAHDGRDPVALRGLTPDRLDLEVVLPAEALLALRLIDEQTRKPVSADVKITRLSSRDATEPDSMDPSLTVLEHRAAAKRLGLDEDEHGSGLYVAGPAGFVGHRLRVTSNGYAPLDMQLPGVAAGEIYELTLELSPASTVSGRVSDGLGAPLADVEVAVRPVDPESDQDPAADDLPQRQPAATDTATDGSYTVGGLSAGEWTLEASHKDYVSLEPMPLALDVAQQLADMDLTLQLGARVSGLVISADDQPAPAHYVQASSVGADGKLQPLTSTRTGADGGFLFTGLPDGPLTLSAQPGAHADVNATRHEEVVVELALRHPARIKGRVTDAAGAPVSCDVLLYAEGDVRWETAATRSNAQGEYQLETLHTGPGMVLARSGKSRSLAVPVRLDFDRTEVRDLRFSGGRIIGRVLVDDTGEPAAGVRLRALALDEDAATEALGIRGMEAEAVTDEDGHFVLGSLSPGRYRLTTHSSQYVPRTPEPVKVTLVGASVTRDLRLTYGATLQGRASTMGEVQTGDLELRLIRIDAEGERFGGIPFEGEYEIKGIPAGHYGYEVKRMGRYPTLPDQDHLFASGEVTLVGGETTRHDIVLVQKD